MQRHIRRSNDDNNMCEGTHKEEMVVILCAKLVRSDDDNIMCRGTKELWQIQTRTMTRKKTNMSTRTCVCHERYQWIDHA